MLKIIIIVALLGIALAATLNVFFTYIPISQIEKDIDTTKQNVDNLITQTKNLESKIITDAENELQKIQAGMCIFCNSLPEFQSECFTLAQDIGANCTQPSQPLPPPSN